MYVCLSEKTSCYKHSLFQDIPIKDAGDDGGVFSAFQVDKPGRMSPVICDSVSSSPVVTEDTLGDLSPPEFNAVRSSGLSFTSEESDYTPDLERGFSQPSQIFVKLAEDCGRTSRSSVATSSLRASIHSKSSSSASAHLGDESNHNLDRSEDESAISHTHVYNLVEQLNYKNESEESVALRLQSTAPRVRKSLQIHRPVERQESQLDIMNLSQPDGDNPWTLALGPSHISISEQASMSMSVSVESSSTTHEIAPVAQPPPRVRTPTSSLASRSVTQYENRSRAGLGPPLSLRSAVPLPYYSGPTLVNPVQKKDAITKTKNFYLKVKRLFTPKSSKPTMDKGVANDMQTSLSHSPYSQDSPSQWSFYRRAFFRTAKSSTPSVAHSNPEFPCNSYFPPVMTREPRHTFECHRSPVPEGIKSSSKRDRRLSVPTSVSGSSYKLPGGNPSFRNFTMLSSHVQRKRWSNPLNRGAKVL